MIYNTQQKKMVMPEYGRNIQNMVDHCVSVEDRKEREKCASSIIDIMGNMFPHLRDVNDFKHILWDHLAIMSDFKLDIDYPYDVIKEEELNTPPQKVDYSTNNIQYKHYGKLLQQMIQAAAEKEEGEEKTALVNTLLNQMKKSYIQWNKDVENEKIFQDIEEISKGKIKIDRENFEFTETKNSGSSNKKNNKNNKSQRKY